MNAHLMRARLLMDQGRFEMALSELQQALVMDPFDPGLHCGMALALLRMGKWNEAKRSADAALEHGPEDGQVHWIRTVVFLERGFLSEAENAVREAIRLDPDDADYHGLLSRVLYEREKHAEAISAAESGLALDAGNDLCMSYRARALSALGRHEESGEMTEALLRDDPLDAWNHCLRGEDLLLAGRPDEARVHFLESLRLDPGNDVARGGFALSLKAQSPLYGMLLAVLIRLGRVKLQAIWGFAIVLYFGGQYGSKALENSPEAVLGFAILKQLIYSGFLLLLLANPMFDLVLRFHKEGQHVLSPDEKRATNWYLICFALAGACGVWASVAPDAFLFRQYGYAMLFLCLPVREIFGTRSRYVRSRLAAITIGLGLLMVLAPLIAPVGVILSLAMKQWFLVMLLFYYLRWMPLVVILYSVLTEYLRKWLEKRCPE